ncbi:DUF2474 domain-containing protein [Acinetobacter guillouiae]|nr:DUF2474 domain-containing protein [Acinetobacter guillouiae]MDO6644946.1 DUF2474 domain-containing protein [Acinetobacter guillouiae]
MNKYIKQLTPVTWFILLWCFGFAALALIAGLFRLMVSIR